MENAMDFSGSDSFDNETFDHTACNEEVEGVSFYKCTFQNVDFQSARLVDCAFDECRFVQCNLSLMEIVGSLFTWVKFTDCKMVGVDWSGTGGFLSASYSGCIMRNNVFADMNLSQYKFLSCDLREAQFSNVRLKSAVFDECELGQCQFHQADLSYANFATSRNYYMNAETNTLKKTVFSLPEAVSLLANLDIVLE